MKKPLALLLATGLAAALLVALGRVFVSSIGASGPAEPAGVVLAPPADALVEAPGPRTPEAAARVLAALAGANPGRPRVAVDYERDGSRAILVLDRQAGTIEERLGGASGTRVATVWKGGLDARLEHARATGRLDAPGLPPPERKNLYH